MDRREKLLGGLDLARQAGLEVGPLDHPLVRKSDGAIRYIDYADAGFLRAKYRDDANVVAANVVEVDAVWGAATAAEALGGTGLFDYALASMWWRHVPDLIAWLAELHAVLKPGATLRLAVPDLRYTFDVLRRETRLADVVAAHLQGARAPLPGQLVDSCLNHHLVDREALWRGDASLPRYRPRASLAHAGHALAEAGRGKYIDVHCWTFTPLSFVELMEQLCALDLVRFTCLRCWPTAPDEDEFFVVLGAGQADGAAETWRSAGERLRQAAASGAESALAAALRAATEAFQAAEARHAADLARLEVRFAELERRTAPLVWLARQAWRRVRG